MDTKVDMTDVVSESFTQYAGAVLQSRALPDVRDCVKPSARQIFYAMYSDGFTYDKPFKKTLKSIAAAMKYYIHGDASVEGIIMRAAQPFAMRYPLVDVEGSYGTQMATESWAAPRYTSSRLSEIADIFIKDTNQHTIDEWEDNYDDTDKYPRLLSSLGYYNIVNGSFGIGLGMASSIPQFNLREVNNALVTLLENPDADFDDIYCVPDFCTGGTIVNADEVKRSIKDGNGKAMVIRSTIEYDKSNSCLVVTDLPYGVYSNTICTELEKAVNKNPDCGIVNVNDLTGKSVNIKIYLRNKRIKPEQIDELKEFLYSNTSLQKSISVNMTMLEDGRFPRVFTWREALAAHLEHERKTYIAYFKHELERYEKRLQIVNGFIYVVEHTDEIIEIIKHAPNPTATLAKLHGLTYWQIKAILDMRLQRLSDLDADKYRAEKESLEKSIKEVNEILGSDDKLRHVMIDKFNDVADKYGDDRKTMYTNLDTTTEKAQNKNEISYYTIEPSWAGKRINYLKRYPEENKSNPITFRVSDEDMIVLFTTWGRMFRIRPKDVRLCGKGDRGTVCSQTVLLKSKNMGRYVDYESVVGIFVQKKDGDSFVPVVVGYGTNDIRYVVMVTKSGYINKFDINQFIGSTRNISGKQVFKFKKKDDRVCDLVYASGGEKLGITTTKYFEDEYGNTHVKTEYKNVDEISEHGINTGGRMAFRYMSNGEEVDELYIDE